MASYPFQDIEKKWQRFWAEQKTFRTPDDIDAEKPKYYVLDMFPYPSGAGLHVGHPEGYTATDIIARYKRMKGFNVLHPMGWDAFGLPAEQYAIQTGTHPRITTERNIQRFREQLQSLGFSYDWDREVNTTDPAYYRWTQWIFKQLYDRGLAYQSEQPVWWCEELGTVLANEEVIDGRSERGGYICVRLPMRQWMLRITQYADRLLDGLDDLEWPESTKEMQRNWIGRSEGADIDFPVVGVPEHKIRVFTTRPDTLFGATYMVLAPEHPLVRRVTTAERRAEVDAYVQQASTKSDLERTELQKEKSGVFTGGHAVNPASGEKIPIWIADYVLAAYGTGAIMAVPAHDERDYQFARTYGLPIRRVITGGDLAQAAWTGDGTVVNSDSEHQPIAGISTHGVSINGMGVADAKEKMIAWLENEGIGRRRVNYKLRDWLFSRQRYWGEPFPVVFVDDKPQTLPETDLPVLLPEVTSYKPSGSPEGPLATVPDWVNTVDSATGAPARRETNTMPQWAGSCWYYLRYIDPHNDRQLVNPDKERYWMPVDLYVGGSEHAVLHLLYARFWHKVLYDLGVVSTEEPFRKLVHQGLILGEMEFTRYVDEADEAVSAEYVDDWTDTRNGRPVRPIRVEESEIEKRGEGFVLKAAPEVRVDARAFKMSKSRGNVINPDEIVRDYGADSLRLYEMFMGPLEQVKPWSTKGTEGVHRFLNRIWRLVIEEDTGGVSPNVTHSDPDREQLRTLHLAIRKVTDDIENLRFNTALAALMEFINAAYKWDAVPRKALNPFLILLNPFAPHLAEEVWHRLNPDRSDSMAGETWPEVVEAYLETDEIEMAVQVNGKLRASIRVPTSAEREAVLDAARAEPNVARHIEGKTVRKEVWVPGRLVNFVVG